MGEYPTIRLARRPLHSCDADSLVQPASLARGRAQGATCALAFRKKLWGRRLARGHLRSDDHDESTHHECDTVSVLCAGQLPAGEFQSKEGHLARSAFGPARLGREGLE